jgi:hypothetical protein
MASNSAGKRRTRRAALTRRKAARQSRRGPRTRPIPHQETAHASGPEPRSVAQGPVPHRAPRPRASAPLRSGANLEPIRACAEPIRELEPGARLRDWMDSTQSAPSANDSSSDARLDRAMSADGHALATLARFDCATSANQHALARWTRTNTRWRVGRGPTRAGWLGLRHIGGPTRAGAVRRGRTHAGDAGAVGHGQTRAGAVERGRTRAGDLARLDPDQHALARLDCATSADGHALATLARLDAGARRSGGRRGRLESQR